MSSPAHSPSDGFDVAVVALSARALARSARRGGLRALSIDLFADADTQEHAAKAVRAPASRTASRFERAELLAVIAREAPERLPVVLGAGFEHAPGLMRAIGRRNPIVGATAETVARLKNPAAFAALLARLGVAHPEIVTHDGGALLHLSPVGRGRRAAPGEGVSTSPESLRPPHPLRFADRPLPAGERWTESAALVDQTEPWVWLSKRAGASGGAHIRTGAQHGHGRYLQRRIEGRAVSALFLANCERAQIIGFSDQWPDPTPRSPFRYGGAVGPIEIDTAIAAEVARALDAIVATTGLLGLASADLILPDDRPETFVLLEINPRSGATLDVFDRGDAPSLLQLHLDACGGQLPERPTAPNGVHAAAVVYAPRKISVGSLPRPVWTADWPSCDEAIPAGAPVCTIVASGVSPHAARALVEDRRAALLASLRAAPMRAPTNTTVTA